jgi:hypothetical protein
MVDFGSSKARNSRQSGLKVLFGAAFKHFQSLLTA